MHQSSDEKITQQMQHRMFDVDFHNFLERESVASDVELSHEFGVSIAEIRKLRKKQSRI